MHIASCTALSLADEMVLSRLAEIKACVLPFGIHQQFENGQVLFYEGQNAEGFYQLQAGRVRLSRRINEEETWCSLVECPSLLGVIQLVVGAPHCYTAAAHDKIEVIFVSKKLFNASLVEREKNTAIKRRTATGL